MLEETKYWGKTVWMLGFYLLFFQMSLKKKKKSWCPFQPACFLLAVSGWIQCPETFNATQNMWHKIIKEEEKQTLRFFLKETGSKVCFRSYFWAKSFRSRQQRHPILQPSVRWTAYVVQAGNSLQLSACRLIFYIFNHNKWHFKSQRGVHLPPAHRKMPQFFP